MVVVSVGTSAAQEQLRTALALGADRALLVETSELLEPLNVAKYLSKVIDQEKPQLILFGKQAIDQENNQVGQMVAQLIGSGQATYASAINHVDGQWVVEREVDGGSQVLALAMPAVVTCDLRLNQPRYASLPNIMKAKKKPLEIIAADTLGASVKEHARLLGVVPPAVRKAGINIGSVAELVDKLKNVAGVI